LFLFCFFYGFFPIHTSSFLDHLEQLFDCSRRMMELSFFLPPSLRISVGGGERRQGSGVFGGRKGAQPWRQRQNRVRGELLAGGARDPGHCHLEKMSLYNLGAHVYSTSGNGTLASLGQATRGVSLCGRWFFLFFCKFAALQTEGCRWVVHALMFETGGSN
jgi:hypothetical protein